MRRRRSFPLIFPRKNFKLWKVVKGIQLALDFFNDKKDRIKKKIALLRRVLQEFERKITTWEELLPERSLIEDMFKVLKKTFSLDNLHKFTYASVAKNTALGFRDKEHLQRLAEW